MPAGEDGLSPCQCPDHQEHRFKVTIAQSGDTADTMFCPYCGRQAQVPEFMPQQMARARAAVQQAATHLVHREMEKIMRTAFGGRGRTPRGGSGVAFRYQPARRPLARPLPPVEVEPTRRTMTCKECRETFAVYSLATYCPSCGRLAPAQQFAGLIEIERKAVSIFDSLEPDLQRRCEEEGLVARTCENAIKNGFSALETYLKERFAREAVGIAKQPASSVFQRLRDASDLYKSHAGLDLEAAAGPDVWATLLRAAAIRHALTHNGGIIDDKFLASTIGWSQVLGQRLVVGKQDALSFLDALDTFARRVLRQADDGDGRADTNNCEDGRQPVSHGANHPAALARHAQQLRQPPHPTLAEAMRQALTAEEAERLNAHL
jgi:hypothetical protein